jgi:glucose/arabinose dehydrogenase
VNTIPSILACLCVLCISAPRASHAVQRAELKIPTGFGIETVIGDLDLPAAFTFVPDGRIFVAEKSGRVKVWKDGHVLAQPLIDIRDDVNDFVDRGLLGMAIDPDFMRNGYLYLLYAWDAPGQARDVDEPRRSRLMRYTVYRDSALPNSGTVLLDDHWNDTQNHSVGTLKFDREGWLWVSLGDGSLSARPDVLSLRALQIDNLQGKLLRIDPSTGNGVPGNPFYDDTEPASAPSRVWSYGFRNPFRFALHPTTTLPYVGDVGWNTWEMLMIATPGSNFGWPCVEGPEVVKDFAGTPECQGIDSTTTTPKQLNYHHDGNNASVTAGDFNMGDHFPAEMKGDFFWGDYSTRAIKRAVLDEDGRFKQVIDFGTDMGEPVDIQFGPDGALYYLSIYSTGLRRIVNTDAKLGSLVTLTQPVTTTRPVAAILSPFDGDTVLGGTKVQLTGAITNATQASWRVTRYDGRRGSVITETQGVTATFTMPSDLRDDGFVEAIFTASNAGELGASKVTLYPPPSDGYIRSWWITNGFPYRTLDDDVLTAGEAKFIARPGDSTAYPIRSASHNINLLKYITPGFKTVGYAFVWIESPDDRTGLLGMNSDDGLAAWLNGEEIWRNKVSRYMPDDKRDIDLPPITLKRGLNALLIKVDTDSGDWQFKARVLNPDGSIMRDAVAKMR